MASLNRNPRGADSKARSRVWKAGGSMCVEVSPMKTSGCSTHCEHLGDTTWLFYMTPLPCDPTTPRWSPSSPYSWCDQISVELWCRACVLTQSRGGGSPVSWGKLTPGSSPGKVLTPCRAPVKRLKRQGDDVASALRERPVLQTQLQVFVVCPIFPVTVVGSREG